MFSSESSSSSNLSQPATRLAISHLSFRFNLTSKTMYIKHLRVPCLCLPRTYLAIFFFGSVHNTQKTYMPSNALAAPLYLAHESETPRRTLTLDCTQSAYQLLAYQAFVFGPWTIGDTGVKENPT